MRLDGAEMRVVLGALRDASEAALGVADAAAAAMDAAEGDPAAWLIAAHTAAAAVARAEEVAAVYRRVGESWARAAGVTVPPLGDPVRTVWERDGGAAPGK